MLRGFSKQRRTGGLLMAALVALGVVAGGPSVQAASTVSFSFDPNGVPAGAQTVDTFQEATGNAVAQNSVNLINAALTQSALMGGASVTTGPFEVFYQATMLAVTHNGVTVFSPGTTGTNQITVTAGFFETATVSSNFPSTALFNANTSQAGSFIEFYSNPTVTANNSTGTGFRDGTQILTGTANVGTALSGNYTNNGTIAPFDNFDNPTPAKFAGVSSVVGQGSSTLTFNITSTNSLYFVTPLTSLTLSFSTQNTTSPQPFQGVSPSQAFYNSATGTTPGYSPSIGTINGSNGADFQFATQAFDTVVPEPASITLAATGIGIVSLASLRVHRRRNRTTVG